jgi:hypothetical protein
MELPCSVKLEKQTRLYIHRIPKQFHAEVLPFRDFGDPIKFCAVDVL